MKLHLSTHHKPYLYWLLWSKKGDAHWQDLMLATLLISVVTIILMYVVMIWVMVGVEQGWLAMEISEDGTQLSGVIYALLFAYSAWILRVLAHVPIVVKRRRRLGASIHRTRLWVLGIVFPLFNIVIYFLLLFLAPSEK